TSGGCVETAPNWLGTTVRITVPRCRRSFGSFHRGDLLTTCPSISVQRVTSPIHTRDWSATNPHQPLPATLGPRLLLAAYTRCRTVRSARGRGRDCRVSLMTTHLR